MAAYRRRHGRHTPRGWWSLFVRLGGWAALLLGAGVVATTLFSAGALYLADRVDGSAGLAYATVTEKRQADGDAYRVTFTYKVKGRGGLTSETEVTRAYYDAVAVGDERPILYETGDPGTIDADVGYYRRLGARLRWIGLGVGLAGLAALWGFGQRANRAVKVRRDGEKRFADVMGIAQARVRVNGQPQGRLTWREQDGQTGESLLHEAEWLRRTYRPGDRIVVFRLGRHAYWEGDVGPPLRETGGKGAGQPPGG